MRLDARVPSVANPAAPLLTRALETRVGYVEQNLIAGERVTYRGHLHWVVFVSLKALLTLFLSAVIERATSEGRR